MMDELLQRHVRANEAAERRFTGLLKECFPNGGARIQSLKKRQHMYDPGDPADHIYLLQSGRVKVFNCAENGKEVILAFHGPGDLFGAVEAFDGACREAFAEALEDSIVAVMHRKDFLRSIEEHPRLALEFSHLLVRHVRTFQSRVQDLVLRNVPSRLAHLIFNLSEPNGLSDRHRPRLEPAPTHQEMADMVGCARETVSTTLGKFREQGLIRTHGRSITILNREAVSQMIA
ncbi:MAG: Crp/Fnr family transcriptional regulator [Nitrospiraceae bacterium]|nr:Crp/Fnr family transcriptional regulator [Nitrospiraceae bacterium]